MLTKKECMSKLQRALKIARKFLSFPSHFFHKASDTIDSVFLTCSFSKGPFFLKKM